VSETVTTFTPDTPPHMLSDYTEERCHELGLPCVRDDNGLTVTVPARPDGLPDWETFLRVAKELQGADGWVMEGAEAPYSYWYLSHDAGPPCSRVPCEIWLLTEIGMTATPESCLADLSRACVEYSRSGGGK